MISILFGTESGNSEMAAEDMANHIQNIGYDAQVIPMEDYDLNSLSDEEFMIVITSTYGEGELPETTAPFHDALVATKPDLSGLSFAAFGLGDSAYENFANAIDTLTATLKSLGAIQKGTTGKHDAARGISLSDASINWVDEILKVYSCKAA